MKDKNDMNTRRMAPLSYSDELARTVLNSLSAHIAILDENGVILETNKAWQIYAVKSGLRETYDHRGVNYLEICDATTGSEAADAGKVAQGIRAVIRGDLEEFLFDYPCHSEDGPHWYYMRTIRMAGPGPIRVVVSHENITPVIKTQEDLKRKELELLQQKKMLEDSNIALKVLLEHRDQDRTRMEENVLVNIGRLIRPYLEKLKFQTSDERSRNIIGIIESRLEEITSPFLNRLTALHRILSPREIDIVTLVREGRTSKEIAELLSISVSGVDFHRKRIRKKLGLTNEKTNLQSYLAALR